MMNSEEIIAKIKNEEEAMQRASERGDIYFPFAVTEEKIKKLNQELKFVKAREQIDWWDFMIPKQDALIIFDELRREIYAR